jgi:hypothetical protein
MALPRIGPILRVVLTLWLTLCVTDALAMRCGTRLVRIGDHKLDVLEKCGEPDSVERRMGIRGSRLRHPRGVLEIEQFEQVEIEEWIYNFGPRKFKQLLEFENGELKEIYDVGYGY